MPTRPSVATQFVQPVIPGLPFGTYHVKARDVEVRLPIGFFGFRRRQGPGKSEVHGQIVGDPPIVLHERTKQFPAAARGRSQKCLIVGRKNTETAQKQVAQYRRRSRHHSDDVAILECIVSYIHFVRRETPARSESRVCRESVERIGK